jgi:hypothetical protein
VSGLQSRWGFLWRIVGGMDICRNEDWHVVVCIEKRKKYFQENP